MHVNYIYLVAIIDYIVGFARSCLVAKIRITVGGIIVIFISLSMMMGFHVPASGKTSAQRICGETAFATERLYC